MFLSKLLILLFCYTLQAILSVLQVKNINELGHLIIEAIESMMKHGLHKSALKYCMILEEKGEENTVSLVA